MPSAINRFSTSNAGSVSSDATSDAAAARREDSVALSDGLPVSAPAPSSDPAPTIDVDTIDARGVIGPRRGVPTVCGLRVTDGKVLNCVCGALGDALPSAVAVAVVVEKMLRR